MSRRKPFTLKRPGPGAANRSGGRLRRAIENAVRKEITFALVETSGNVSDAARILGLSRRGLSARLSSLSIDADAYRR